MGSAYGTKVSQGLSKGIPCTLAILDGGILGNSGGEFGEDGTFPNFRGKNGERSVSARATPENHQIKFFRLRLH